MPGRMTDRLVVPIALLDELLEHARADYPHECCGLLTGRGDVVTGLRRMTNVAASPVAYLMDPGGQLEAFDAIDQSGDELLAIYHSHPTLAAYPSPTDVQQSHYPDVAYVIVSLADLATPVTRAFRIADEHVVELELRRA